VQIFCASPHPAETDEAAQTRPASVSQSAEPESDTHTDALQVELS